GARVEPRPVQRLQSRARGGDRSGDLGEPLAYAAAREGRARARLPPDRGGEDGRTARARGLAASGGEDRGPLQARSFTRDALSHAASSDRLGRGGGLWPPQPSHRHRFHQACRPQPGAIFPLGRKLPWWLLGTSMVATTFSTDTPNLVTDMVRNGGV